MSGQWPWPAVIPQHVPRRDLMAAAILHGLLPALSQTKLEAEPWEVARLVWSLVDALIAQDPKKEDSEVPS